MTSSLSHVLVLFAMDQEATPLIEKLDLKPFQSAHPKCPMELFQGELGGMKITVATNGKCARFGVQNVGTTPAALTAYLAVTSLAPDLVINAGTAGGFRAKGGSVGDVYIGTTLCHHDRRIPIPGFTEYGIGNHSSLECRNLIKALGCKVGVITTSNSLDHTPVDDEMMLKNDASVKDMEAAALGWVAEMLSVPFFCIKVITDIVDGDRTTEEEFLENLSTAAKSLQDIVPRALDFVSKVKNISEL